MADSLNSLPVELKYGDGLNASIITKSGTIYFDTNINHDFQNTCNFGGMYININGILYALVPEYNKIIKYDNDTNTIILE